MQNKLKKFSIAASTVAVSASTAMLTVPQLSEPGYVEYNTKTQEIRYVESNSVKAFASNMVSDKIVEKNVVYSVPKPINKAFAEKKKVVTDYPILFSIFEEVFKYINLSCVRQPAPTPPPPVPPAPPTPEPTPGPDNEVMDWGYAKIYAADANAKVDSSVVGVCFIDTGVDLNHPDLKGKIKGAVSFVPGESPQDVFGHGTHIAGVIAATTGNKLGVKGVSKAFIYSAKVLSQDGSGDIPWIVSGLKWCAQQPGVKVISGSLGSSEESAIMKSAIGTIASKGIIQTYAAGNESQPVLSYPARHAIDFETVVAVTATRTDDMRATFSNYELRVPTIGAPGTNIYSTVPVGGCSLCDDGSGYAKMSGTSMATPHIAGVLALMIAAGKSTLVGDQVKDPTIMIRVNALKTVTN